MNLRIALVPILMIPWLTVSCARNPSNVVRVTTASYNAHTQTIHITAQPASPNSTGENVVNINDPESISHFASYAAPDQPVKQVIVIGEGNPETRIVAPAENTNINAAGAMVFQNGPVPGVRMDPSIHPLADINASALAKGNAVIQEARSKLGTPYIWGHNEDRGQYGFDCSNFTAYVYHHALGYEMSGASQAQFHSVGNPTARRNTRVGDLLIFEQGKHVGIYAGGDKAIQCGGGLGKVGYISVSPNSYWGNQITAVKSMF